MIGKRGHSLQRRGPKRDPLVKLIILCEGKNSEPQYLRELVADVKNPLLEVEVVGPCGVPITLVEEAKRRLRGLRRKADNPMGQNDEVWVVFDCDEHPRVEEARNLARQARIGVAYSNPCFELWGMLHIKDHDAPMHRHDLQKALQLECAEYRKSGGKIISFNALKAGYGPACERASRMRERRIKDGGQSPYTDVDLLTEKIVANSKKREP